MRDRQAILCTRRPRSAEERPPWMMHLMTVQGTTVGETSFETDRMQFIGRGRTLAAPAAMDAGPRLSDSAGSGARPDRLHPPRRSDLQPNETVRVDLVTGVAETREAVAGADGEVPRPAAWPTASSSWPGRTARSCCSSSTPPRPTPRLTAGWRARSSTPRRCAGPKAERLDAATAAGNRGSGATASPAICRSCSSASATRTSIELVRQARAGSRLLANARGSASDLVIWNEDDSVYRQTLQDTIMDLVAASPEAAAGRQAGRHLRPPRRADVGRGSDRCCRPWPAWSWSTTRARWPSRSNGAAAPKCAIPRFEPRRRRRAPPSAEPTPQRDLAFFNGLGGFSRDGREYVSPSSARADRRPRRGST